MEFPPLQDKDPLLLLLLIKIVMIENIGCKSFIAVIWNVVLWFACLCVRY